MNTFHDLITRCESLGTKDKLAQVQKLWVLDDIKEVFRLMLDKTVLYNIKAIPAYILDEDQSIDVDTIGLFLNCIHVLLKADFRGAALDARVVLIHRRCTPEFQDIFTWILDRKNPAKISASIVNKVWPGLIYKQDYMGAIPGSDEALTRLFEASPEVSVQTKEDGMSVLVKYENGVPTELRTRQGQDITRYFPIFLSRLYQDINPDSVFSEIVHHELFVQRYDTGVFLDRKTGNGLINKGVKSGKYFEVVDEALRSVILDHYGEGTQFERFFAICHMRNEYSKPVQDKTVHTLSEARDIAKEVIRAGGEGVICKHPGKPFKDGKPWFNVKIKNEFIVDLVCTGVNPHKKHPELIGSLRMETSDGLLQVNVGSGFTDILRKVPPEDFLGCIIEVTANEIIKSKGKKKASLYLPRFGRGDLAELPVRYDKWEADTYPEVQEQEKASKVL